MTPEEHLIAKALGDLARIEDFLCKTMGEKADIQTNLHGLVAENLSRKERIAALEAELVALKAQVQQWQSEAAEAAGHELGLWPMGAVAAVGGLKAEVAALREDRERLDDVERLRIRVSYRGGMPYSIKPWTACGADSVLHAADTARAAIDAARKERK